jgi:hypothetical protein
MKKGMRKGMRKEDERSVNEAKAIIEACKNFIYALGLKHDFENAKYPSAIERNGRFLEYAKRNLFVLMQFLNLNESIFKMQERLDIEEIFTAVFRRLESMSEMRRILVRVQEFSESTNILVNKEALKSIYGSLQSLTKYLMQAVYNIKVPEELSYLEKASEPVGKIIPMDSIKFKEAL